MLIAPENLWLNGALHRGLAVEVSGGRISALRPLGTDTPDATAFLLMPACTDLQVNGGGGVMVNTSPTPEGLRTIAAAHRALGTGGLLPTVITDAPEVMEAAADAVLATHGTGGILGLHIEGPHLAPARRGTHDPAHIRPLDRRTVNVVARLRAAGVPVMLTLAPERADPALLTELAATGAVLSAGHSAATADETRAALGRGITCFTHLYNAMPPMTARAPGIVGAAITSTAYCGMIVDGIHVHWDMLRIALAARPRKGLCFAVSDAMATVGGPDRFSLYGRDIAVKDGALVNDEGNLAGAHLDMVTSLANLAGPVGLPLAEAVAMVTDTPRRVMGLAPVALAERTALCDLIALDAALAPVPLPR